LVFVEHLMAAVSVTRFTIEIIELPEKPEKWA